MRLSVNSWRGGGANAEAAGQSIPSPGHKDQWESSEELVELLGVPLSKVTSLRILKSLEFLGFFQHVEKMY